MLCACVQQRHAVSGDLTTLHAGSLHLPTTPSAPMRIFVDSPGNSTLADTLGRQLKNSRFQVVDAPSKAGYILHVTVLNQGQVNPEVLKAAVNSGYGAPSAFSGKGAYAMLADALMVQRRVPEAKRPTRQKLKNISARNAIDNTQMRLAVLDSHEPSAQGKEAFITAMTRELATQIKE